MWREASKAGKTHTCAHAQVQLHSCHRHESAFGYQQQTAKKLTGVNKMTTTKTTEIKQLQDFAHANYEDGGHWVYETFDCADYQEMLDNNKGNMEICKAQLRHHWEQLCMLEREYAFGDE
jgi:hypothetical protein